MTSDETQCTERLADRGPAMLDSLACNERAARLTEGAESNLAVVSGCDAEMLAQASAWERLAVVAGVQDVLMAALAAADTSPKTRDD